MDRREFIKGAGLAALMCVATGVSGGVAPLPADSDAASPEAAMAIGDAWHQANAARERWSLNGLWMCRPALTADGRDFVPDATADWAWKKVPFIVSRRENVLEPWEFPPSLKKLKDSDWIKDRAWLAREFTMPASAAGKRVTLVFMMLTSRAEVYVDGKRAGLATWPNGEVDLTEFVRPGKRQVIALDHTAYPFDPTTLDYIAPGRVVVSKSTLPVKGITGDVYLELTPKGARVENAYVETSVEKGEITFVAEGADAKRMKVAVCDLDGTKVREFDGSGCRFTAEWKDARLWDLHTPGNRYRATFSLYDGSGRLIDESFPVEFGFREFAIRGRDFYLNGKKIHLRALVAQTVQNEFAAIACKESCLESCRRFKEDGWNLAMSCNFGYNAGAMAYPDGFLDACDETGILYSFTLPHIKSVGVDNLDRDEPEAWRKYRAALKKAIDRVRNRPSVVLWAFNHNCTGYDGDLDPRHLGNDYTPERHDANWKTDPWYRFRRAAHKAWEAVKALDATRPCYHHESGNLDEMHTINCYLNWAPRQERSEWPMDWSKTGTKPLFFVEWGVPHVATWSDNRGPNPFWNGGMRQTCMACEGAAQVRGEAAYEDDPTVHDLLVHDDRNWASGEKKWFNSGFLDRMTNNHYGVQAHYLRDNLPCFRAWGVSAIQPYDQENNYRLKVKQTKWWKNPDRYRDLKRPGLVPDNFGAARQYTCDSNSRDLWQRTEYGDVIHRWNQPSCAFIGGEKVVSDKTHVYRMGERIAKTLVVINDERETRTYRWAVKFVDAGGGEVGKRLSGQVSIEPGEKAELPIVLAAPKTLGEFRILSAVACGDWKMRDAFDVSVLGGREPAQSRVFLLDSAGKTAAELRRLGVRFEKVDSLAGAVPDANAVFVVGRESLTPEIFRGQVVGLANRGGRVVVFEQGKPTLEAIGFRVQRHGLRSTWRRYRDARTKDLPDGLLRDWRGESTLIAPYDELPPELVRGWVTDTFAGFRNQRVRRCGNRNAVATVLVEKPTRGNWRSLVDGGFDLRYAPLLECKVSGGNGRIVFCQLDVTARTEVEPAADRVIRGLLAKAPPEGGYADVEICGTCAWSFVQAGCANESQERDSRNVKCFLVSDVRAAPANLPELVRNGAVAVCAGLDAEGVRKICPLAPPCEDVRGRCFDRIAEFPSELNGLSNADVFWHGAMDFAAFTDKVRDGNSAFRVVRHGKGKYVFMQVAPWMMDVESRPQLRGSKRVACGALEILCGNAGFVTSFDGGPLYRDTPMRQDDPYRFLRW